MKPYTYLIRHLPTNRVYYGVRTANRVEPAADLWKTYFTSSPAVKRLIEEYGANSFDYEVRQVFDTAEAAISWEVKVLQRCRVLEDSRWINANVAGYIKPTPESNKKISDYWKGKPKSAEQRQKMSDSQKGKPKDYCRTEEYRSKMSAAKSGEKNAMYGRKHSVETLAKISAAKKGQSSHQKDKPRTEEQKQKQREKMAGRKQDPEVVARRAETQRALKLKRERVICKHCGKEIPVNIFARYHGDRCKSRK
jgi:hypothetical protein